MIWFLRYTHAHLSFRLFPSPTGSLSASPSPNDYPRVWCLEMKNALSNFRRAGHDDILPKVYLDCFENGHIFLPPTMN